MFSAQQRQDDRALLMMHPANDADRIKTGNIPYHWLNAPTGTADGPKIYEYLINTLNVDESLQSGTEMHLTVRESNGAPVVYGHLEDAWGIWSFLPGRIRRFARPPQFSKVTYADLQLDRVRGFLSRGLLEHEGDDYVQTFGPQGLVWEKVRGPLRTEFLPTLRALAWRHINRVVTDKILTLTNVARPHDRGQPHETPQFLEHVFRNTMPEVLKNVRLRNVTHNDMVEPRLMNFWRYIECVIANADAFGHSKGPGRTWNDVLKVLIEMARATFNLNGQMGTRVVPQYHEGADWAFLGDPKDPMSHPGFALTPGRFGNSGKAVDYTTAPIKAGQRVDLLRITHVESLIGVGDIDHCDMIHPRSIRMETFVFRNTGTGKFMGFGLPKHHQGWQQAIEGNHRQWVFKVEGSEFFDELRAPVQIQGEVNVELGSMKVWATSEFDDRDDPAPWEFVGYELSFERVNQNVAFSFPYRIDIELDPRDNNPLETMKYLLDEYERSNKHRR